MKRWLLPTLLFVLVGVWVLNLLQTPTLDGVASEVITALIEDRPERAYKYIHESQREHLTRDQFADLWRKVIAPKYDPYEPDGPVRIRVAGFDTQATATLPLKAPNGKTTDLIIRVDITDRGPRFDPFWLLMGTWYVDWTVTKGNNLSSATGLHDAAINGLANDIPTLRAIGIQSICSPDPGVEPRPLDEVLRAYNRAKQRMLSSMR